MSRGNCRNDRALDLASMSRDSSEVGLIRRVPPIDGQLAGEFLKLVHSVLITHGYDVPPTWDYADGVNVSARCRSRHKHVACGWSWPARHRRDGHGALPFDCPARLAHARSGFFSGHLIVYLSLELRWSKVRTTSPTDFACVDRHVRSTRGLGAFTLKANHSV
jgi:hypothetical protein